MATDLTGLKELSRRLAETQEAGGELASDLLQTAVLERWPTAVGYDGGADAMDGESFPRLLRIVGPGDETLAENDDYDEAYDSEFWDEIASECVSWVADQAYCNGSWANGASVRWEGP